MRALLLGTALLLLFDFPCAKAPAGNPVQTAPSLDRGYFEDQVQPELLASCAFSQCHGAANRPLRLFSPAGLRVRPGLPPGGLVEEEIAANFERARLAAAPVAAGLPDLLRKPLQLEAGGAGHTGVDPFGKNVYPDQDAAGWKVLREWVNGAVVEDAGTGGGTGGGAGGGGGTVTCNVSPGNSYATVATIITTATCARDEGCHTPTNAPDAGCFRPDSCETVRMSGCLKPSVIPCDGPRSKLLQYTGPPFGIKAHQGVLLPSHQAAILAWIDGGASCDGGGP